MAAPEAVVVLNPKQRLFWKAGHRISAFVGGWGCGKSTVARLALVQKHLVAVPQVEVWACMNTYRQLEDSLIPDFFRQFPQLERFFVRGDLAVTLPNKSSLKFRYVEDPEKITNVNLRAAWIEQAEDTPEASALKLLGRLRHSAETQLLLTANTAGKNWLHQWFKQGQAPDDASLVEAVTQDNAAHLPAAYVASLERLRTTRPRIYERYVLNSWASAEGAVWPEFSEAKHVIPPFPVPPTWRCGIALDHGYRNPTAVLWWAMDQDGVVYIVDEHYESGQTVEYHSARIKQRPAETWKDAIADSSIFSRTQEVGGVLLSIAERYHAYGIPFRPAQRKADTDLVMLVGSWFALDRIRIFANCVNTIREVREYQWAKVKQVYLEKHDPPERTKDVDNHACDCLCYLIAERPMPAAMQQPPSILDTIRRRGTDYETVPQKIEATVAGLP